MTFSSAQKLVVGNARKGAIIDTNLLLLLWIGSYDRSLIQKFKRTKAFTPEDFDLLESLLKPLSRLFITPHIMTEISNFSGQLPEETCKEFRSLIAQMVEPCEEHTIPSKSLMAGDSFPRFGITDVGLVEIANRGVLVITAELPLTIHLRSLNRRVLNFTEVRRVYFGWR